MPDHRHDNNEQYAPELPPCGCDVDEVLAPRPASVDDVLLSQILATVRGLRYGSVELVLHDGRVVQIERREKTRLDR